MSPGRFAAWLLALGLLLVSAASPGPPRRRTWILGPLVEVASDVQWVRFQTARHQGRNELALRRAESAISLAPWRSAGWELLVAHLGYFLASPEREPDLARRRAWFRAALDVLDRAISEAENEEELLLLRAVLLLSKTEVDPDVWPAGAEDLRREADEAVRAAGLEEGP